MDNNNFYFLYDNLLYKLPSNNNNNIEIIENIELVEKNSKICYIPNNFEIIKKENELYSTIKENFSFVEDDIDNIYIQLSKFNDNFYISKYTEKLLNNLDLLKKNNIELINIIDYFNEIFSKNKKNLIENNMFSYLYLIPFMNKNENYFLSFLIKLKNNEYVIDKIEFYDENDIENNVSNKIFSEQRNNNIMILYTSNEIKNLNNIYNELLDFFDINKILENFELDSGIIDLLKQNFSNSLIIEDLKITQTFFTNKLIKSKEINLLKYFNKIKKHNNFKYIILASVIFLFGGINYYINNIIQNNIIDNFDNQIDTLKNNYQNLIIEEKKQKAERIHSIINKKYSKADKQFLTLPYLLTYLSHFKLKIKGAELLFFEKNVKYYGVITVQGMLPQKLLLTFKNTIGLQGLDIVPSKNVIQNGFTYVLTFDMSKVYKILYKKGLINVQNF